MTAWTGKQITGVLTNDPQFVKALKAGDIVTVNEDEIFDYIHYRADGTQDGNETTKILEKMQSR